MEQMAPLQDGDDPPEGAYKAPIQDQQSQLDQKTVDPAPQGGYACPSTGSFALHTTRLNPSKPPKSLVCPILMADLAAVAESKTFAKCGHVISGLLYRDFLTKPDSGCPVCQQGPFQAVVKFGSCEHLIVGDPLNRVFKSRTNQCSVCNSLGDNKDVATHAHSNPTSPTPTDQDVATHAHSNRISPAPTDQDVATQAHSNPIGPTPTAVHTERSRVTLNKYQDPYTFEGVTDEMYRGKDGKPRLRVDEKVWRSWSSYQKDRFVYSTNIRFNQPVGEHTPAPTNPGNPRHPEYNPFSNASILRRNLKQKPDPDRVAAAIRELLAMSDQDVAADKSPLRQSNGAEMINEPVSEGDNPEDVTRDGSQELYHNPWQ